MYALQLFGPDDIRKVEIPTPTIGPDDVLVEVESAGLCGTEPGVYHRGEPQGRVPGHEYGGRVVQVGAQVKRVRVGDRVTGLWRTSCGRCAECRAGMPEICSTPGHLGTHYDGSFAEQLLVPNADRCILRLGEDLSFDAGVVVGCSLITAMWGLARARISPGDALAVFGLGAVGLCAILGACFSGVRAVIAIDPVPYRRELAIACGAGSAWDPSDSEVARLLRLANDGSGVDRAIVSTPAASAPEQALDGTRRGGSVVLIGVIGNFTIHSRHLIWEKTLTGAAGAPGADFGQRIVDLVGSGRIDPRKLGALVTHRYSFDEAATAFQVYEGKSEPVIKAVFHP